MPRKVAAHPSARRVAAWPRPRALSARHIKRHMMKRRNLSLALAACFAIPFAQPAIAADWPEREITLTVMYGAGGNTDLMARAFAKQLEVELGGKRVIVVNRPGAQGTLGPDWVRQQKPDGYNIGFVSGSTLALTPHLTPVKFTLDDFTFLGAFAMPRFGVAVNAESPYKTMDDLVKAARSGKGVFLGSGAALNSLILTNLNATHQTRFDVVAYKSGAEVNTALLGNQVAVIVTNPPDILPFVATGKMRMLASASPKRWPELQDVPTMKELGMASTVAESWTGLAAPKGLPKDVAARLEAATTAVANSKEFKAALVTLGADSNPATGAELENYMRTRSQEWGVALQRANLIPAK
ncbi:MAG: tripartite tricarboxylate transporter substrate binding protein [Haliea sp.]|nr:MAG: tripartite tricarboxylate transporter substrate binding protein [Haliea sp.]